VISICAVFGFKVSRLALVENLKLELKFTEKTFPPNSPFNCPFAIFSMLPVDALKFEVSA
jgi:hypothetical protein